jgi:hypothetical protein
MEETSWLWDIGWADGGEFLNDQNIEGVSELPGVRWADVGKVMERALRGGDWLRVMRGGIFECSEY